MQLAPSPSTEPMLRRSDRNLEKLSAASDAVKADPTARLGVLNDGLGNGERRPRALGMNSHESRKDVERAVHNLQAMESELQTTVRNQREALETSNLQPVRNDGTDTKADASMPLDPNLPSRPGKQVVNEGDERCANSVEQAPLDGHKAELAKGDIAGDTRDPEPDEDGTQRGARRPPPVNSMSQHLFESFEPNGLLLQDLSHELNC